MRRLTILLILVMCPSFAASASAERAWVLWSQQAITIGTFATTGAVYEPVGTHSNQKDCELIADAMERRIREPGSGYTKVEGYEGLYAKKMGSSVVMQGPFKCFPDAVDPRGPRGK